LEARLDSARADAAFAISELERFTRLNEERVISPDEMDRARTRRDATQALVASLEAELETARLGARTDEVNAGRADTAAAQAALDKARWALAQKRQLAPTNGVIHDTLYREGEWIAAGKPVVSLLPPANRKVRFFVPQERLPDIQPGTAVSVSVDGVPEAVPATISYVSTEAEFTPPVIYSRENRAKLVFMVEAVVAPEAAARLSPGQPADVRVTR
jgi:HlyD family secretion protein